MIARFPVDRDGGYYLVDTIELEIMPDDISKALRAKEHELLLRAYEDDCESIDVEFTVDEYTDMNIISANYKHVEVTEFSRAFTKAIAGHDGAIAKNWHKIKKLNE